MTRYYRRRRASPEETAAVAVAAGVAAAVGAVAFYVTRIVLAREPLGDAPGEGDPGPDREGASRRP